jgi:hypothetical protein
VANGLGNPKVDDSSYRFTISNFDKDVGRFYVPMDYAFLVSVLDSITGLIEQH